jgi:hypothetical protein
MQHHTTGSQVAIPRQIALPDMMKIMLHAESMNLLPCAFASQIWASPYPCQLAAHHPG